uniref:Uncharacterized protein n=1 Tax=Schistosoma mansoni TaxID=6183 RepID=A0A913KVM0_SCHMA
MLWRLFSTESIYQHRLWSLLSCTNITNRSKLGHHWKPGCTGRSLRPIMRLFSRIHSTTRMRRSNLGPLASPVNA